MNEIEKLRLLLPHWQVHNQEHAGEFHTWAERARALGEAHLAAHIEAAAQKMEAASRDLESAIELVGRGNSDPAHEHTHHHDHTH